MREDDERIEFNSIDGWQQFNLCFHYTITECSGTVSTISLGCNVCFWRLDLQLTVTLTRRVSGGATPLLVMHSNSSAWCRLISVISRNSPSLMRPSVKTKDEKVIEYTPPWRTMSYMSVIGRVGVVKAGAPGSLFHTVILNKKRLEDIDREKVVLPAPCITRDGSPGETRCWMSCPGAQW